MKEIIYTERLVMRAFLAEDDIAFYELMKDKEVNTFLPWYPPKNIEEARAMLEESYLCQKSGYHYAICLKEMNKPIGYIHISGDESHDLGYGLCREYWHQGIVSEACKAVLKSVKEDGLPFITATHDQKNPRSGEVMKRLGMKYEYSYEEQVQPKNNLVTFRLYQLNFKDNQEVFMKYWNIYEHHFIEDVQKETA